MARPGIITLLTDFGLSDPFVGIMKGVILSRFAGAQIVDLTHGIPPQAVAEAWAFECITRAIDKRGSVAS